MKCAKILFVAIIILATVGTTFAFKVTKKGNLRYCYLITTKAPGTHAGACPHLLTDGVPLLRSPVNFYYTTLNAIDCVHQTYCINQAKMFGNR
jgi:hypothetical protein